MGGGGFSAGTNFFFRALLVQEFFLFSGETPCTNFFFRQILLFLTVTSWFIIYFFVTYKLFYTHNRSKDTGHFLMQNLFQNVHTVREEEATWSGRLPCTIFQSLPFIQGDKTHPLIFIVGTNNFIEYLQRYQIVIFIYYKFYFIIFIITQY